MTAGCGPGFFVAARAVRASQSGAEAAAAVVVSPRRKDRRVGPLVELPIASIMAQVGRGFGRGKSKCGFADVVAVVRSVAYSSSKAANVARKGVCAWHRVRPQR